MYFLRKFRCNECTHEVKLIRFGRSNKKHCLQSHSKVHLVATKQPRLENFNFNFAKKSRKTQLSKDEISLLTKEAAILQAELALSYRALESESFKHFLMAFASKSIHIFL